MGHRAAGLRAGTLTTSSSAPGVSTHYVRTIETSAPGGLGVRLSDDPFASSPWPPPFSAFRCVVASVYDGDTLTGMVEMSDFMYVMKDIRLLGVDCYELRKGRKAWRAKGAAAQAFTAQRIPPGTQIIIREPTSEVSSTEKYGRLLGRVFYKDAAGTEHDLAAELVAAGFQKPGSIYGPTPAVTPAKPPTTKKRL